jgi:hypothetical protein
MGVEGYCQKCCRYYSPEEINKFAAAQLFGHGLQSCIAGSFRTDQLAMSAIPTLTEQKIRTFVGEQNFQKGQQLVRDGAIINPEQQAMALKAYCYGSLPEPYRVQVTFDGSGINSYLCSCPTVSSLDVDDPIIKLLVVTS